MDDTGLTNYEDVLDLDVPNLRDIVSPCKYYTLPVDCLHTDKFAIIHLNARSVRNKFDEIQNLLTASGVDWSVVCISETWLKEYQLPYYSIEKYEMFASCRGSGEGGGSLLYVSKRMDVKHRQDLESNFFETSFVEINNSKLNGKNIIVGNIYRPPNSSHNLFIEYVENLLDLLEREKKTVILSGDFNYNLRDVMQDQHTLNFSNLLSSYCYFPTIFRPTRIQGEKQSILDNFYINELCYHDKSGVVIDDISDHLPIFLYLATGNSSTRHITRKKIFDRAKAQQLSNFLTFKNIMTLMKPVVNSFKVIRKVLINAQKLLN